MRNGEQGRCEDKVVVKEDVNVNQAWTVAEGLGSAQRRLQPLEVFEQGLRFEVGFRPHCLIEECLLRRVTPGWRFVEVRLCLHGHLRGKQCNRLLEVGGAVAEVGAEGKVNGVFHVHSPGTSSRSAGSGDVRRGGRGRRSEPPRRPSASLRCRRSERHRRAGRQSGRASPAARFRSDGTNPRPTRRHIFESVRG